MIARIKNPYSLLRRGWIPMRFDMIAWFKVCEINGLEFDELTTLPEQHLFLSLMYAGYWSHQANVNEKQRYDFAYISKVYRWYYINDYDALHEVSKAIEKSKIMGKTLAEWKSGEKKKSP